MKRLYILLFLLLQMPVFAACPITGFCAPSNSVLSSPGLQEKYLPNNLNTIQKPNAFTKDYRKPYDSVLINTEQNSNQQNNSINGESSSYNSNCQFGVCLPGSGMEEEIIP